MNSSSDNSCAAPASKLIFSCSGAADVGLIADQAARKLTREGAGKMFCLAGVGGRVPEIMKVAKAASKILAVDGCQMGCVAKCLEEAGFTEFGHIQLADLGLKKGESPLTDDRLTKVCTAAEEILAS